MSRYLLQQALRGRQRPTIGGEDDRLPLDQEAFYQHLGSDDVVRLEPDMDQDEVFDDQFERRAHEIQRTPGQDRTVSTVPNKKGPWSGNNNLGIERPFDPDANNRQTILKLPEWGFPEMWTLCLGLYFDINTWAPSGSNEPAFDVTAVIEFGSGGCIQTVECDWVNGATISLPMNAVNVIAQYNFDEENEGVSPSEPPLDLRLRATLVRNQLSTILPTRTLKQPIIDGTVINIPPFARRMQVLPGLNIPLNSIATFFSQIGGARFMSGVAPSPLGRGVAAYSWSQMVEYLSITDNVVGAPSWITVPTGARSVAFEISADSLSSALVVFEVGV
jgi:hypothetical protein